ncbi:heat shock 70 kDa protein 12B-like [Saccostrea cucullata]|uniref:heat shock 70 kDa protein 12B-like n=1 Tax=Saccostrea cuccullata TaxID=36930 RepID=UPI002ED1359C
MVDCNVAVGIRIGTNYTTYAWNRRSIEDPAFVSAQWTDSTKSLLFLETPTIALFGSDKKLQAFGFEAEKEIQEKTNNHLLVFREFIQDLFCNGIQVPSHLTAENGVLVLSSDIMTQVIAFLLRKLPIEPSKIVFTVPSAATKDTYNFFKKSARKAGLEKVYIIPEATSVLYYCKEYHRLYKTTSSKEVDVFAGGKQSIVLECEDDNVSISVLEVRDGVIKIVYNSFSNVLAACQVQNDFEAMIIEIVGESVFDDFYRNNRLEYFEIVNELRRKMTVDIKEEKPLNINIPPSLITAFEKTTGKTLNEALQQTIFSDKMSFNHGKCRIMPEIFHNLFKEAGANIVQLLNKAMADSGLSKTGSIILVGFFSRSTILQDMIKKSFPTCHVIVPEDSNMVVVKGAAIYGQKPVKIQKHPEVKVDLNKFEIKPPGMFPWT